MPVTIGGSGPITGVTSINTSVSDTELGYLDGVSSALQTQIDSKPTGGTGAWTSYTPTWTGLTQGNGTSTGAYTQIGKTVFFRAKIVFGSTSSMGSSGVSASLPVAASSGSLDSAFQIAFAFKSGFRYYPLMTVGGTVFPINTSATYGTDQAFSSTIPFNWASGDNIYVSGTYEAA